MPALTTDAVPRGSFGVRKQPTLAVDDLTLRPWRLSDAAAVALAYDDPEIRQWHARTMDLSEARAWVGSWAERWAAETGAGWAVTRQDTLVGRTGFGAFDLRDGSAEAAYWTLPAARGGGVASRALDTVSGWMMSHAGFHRLELNHSVRNLGSVPGGRAGGLCLRGHQTSAGAARRRLA